MRYLVFAEILLLFIPKPLYSQKSNLGLGWARNSVNTPVFRKNSITSFNGIQYSAYYDSLGNVILGKRDLNNQKWELKKTPYKGNVKDAHCSISIAVDGNGYIHMAWDHHNDSLRYCKSVKPESLELDNKMKMIGSRENDVTYPEFYRLPSGDLIFIYRYGISGRGNMVMNRYYTKTGNWERIHDVLIDGENERNAYWQLCVDNKGSIHISWVWRETWDVSSNHDMCYAKSDDGGISWKKSNNESYHLPITIKNAEIACQIEQGSELINQTSMTTDSEGNPYIAAYWTPQNSDIPQYHLIYLDDQQHWKNIQISDRKTKFSLSGGGTKKIPISRPQILIKDENDTKQLYLLYRDQDKGSRVCINKSDDINSNKWFIYYITDFSVNSWEPTYDIDLWKSNQRLSIFVQNTGQGDGETLEHIPPQPVFIFDFNENTAPSDTLFIPNLK